MTLTNLIGIIAAVLSVTAFLPQVAKTVKTKSTKDLSLAMFAGLIIGIALWLTYGILKGAYPIIIANSIILVLASIVLAYKLKYK